MKSSSVLFLCSFLVSCVQKHEENLGRSGASDKKSKAYVGMHLQKFPHEIWQKNSTRPIPQRKHPSLSKDLKAKPSPLSAQCKTSLESVNLVSQESLSLSLSDLFQFSLKSTPASFSVRVLEGHTLDPQQWLSYWGQDARILAKFYRPDADLAHLSFFIPVLNGAFYMLQYGPDYKYFQNLHEKRFSKSLDENTVFKNIHEDLRLLAMLSLLHFSYFQNPSIDCFKELMTVFMNQDLWKERMKAVNWNEALQTANFQDFWTQKEALYREEYKKYLKAYAAFDQALAEFLLMSERYLGLREDSGTCQWPQIKNSMWSREDVESRSQAYLSWLEETHQKCLTLIDDSQQLKNLEIEKTNLIETAKKFLKVKELWKKSENDLMLRAQEFFASEFISN